MNANVLADKVSTNRLNQWSAITADIRWTICPTGSNMTLPELLKYHKMDVGCLHSGEHNHKFVSCASMTHSSQTQKMKMYDSKQSFKNDPLFMST